MAAPLVWCKPQGASCLNSGGLPRALPVYQYSQQQHTVFTSTHCHLSPVDSLNVLRVTVLLCVQSDTHRRFWIWERQWENLCNVRGFPAFWNWKKYLQYQKNSKIGTEKMEGSSQCHLGSDVEIWPIHVAGKFLHQNLSISGEHIHKILQHFELESGRSLRRVVQCCRAKHPYKLLVFKPDSK